MGVPEAIVIIAAVSMTIGLPMFILAVRFALKPLLEAYLQVRRLEGDNGRSQELNALRERVAVLESILAKERPGELEGVADVRALPSPSLAELTRRVR